jgi:hypothetical protein
VVVVLNLGFVRTYLQLLEGDFEGMNLVSVCIKRLDDKGFSHL